jgi:hypothetical protein
MRSWVLAVPTARSRAALDLAHLTVDIDCVSILRYALPRLRAADGGQEHRQLHVVPLQALQP